MRQWREIVPHNFVFSVKASRYITHQKKLNDPQQTLEPFLERISLLVEKSGLILFQLPLRWYRNLARLTCFLQALPSEYRYVFEFRDTSWFHKEVYETLAVHKAAFCMYDLNRQLSPKEITADLIYIRLHGPKKSAQNFGSPTQQVGAAPVGKLKKVKHMVPMLSLWAVLEEDEVQDFLDFLQQHLETQEISYILEPKFDGVSVEERSLLPIPAMLPPAFSGNLTPHRWLVGHWISYFTRCSTVKESSFLRIGRCSSTYLSGA